MKKISTASRAREIKILMKEGLNRLFLGDSIIETKKESSLLKIGSKNEVEEGKVGLL